MVLDRDSRKWLLQLHPEVSGPGVVCVSTNTLGASARVCIARLVFPQAPSWRAPAVRVNVGNIRTNGVKRHGEASAVEEEEGRG